MPAALAMDTASTFEPALLMSPAPKPGTATGESSTSAAA
jgi:hypothetical protein